MENKLRQLLSKESVDNQINNFNENNYWYKSTYKLFLEKFQATRGSNHVNAWIERVALIYSWLPTIPLNAFTLNNKELQEQINILTELENYYFEAQLETIGKTSYLGSDPDFHGEIIFPSYNGSLDSSIRHFLYPAGKILHQDPNFDSQLSSITKLLHFMCPNLFPIFDRKVCKKLFGSEHQSYKRYHQYVFLLHSFLQETDEGKYICEQASKINVSPLYIVDLVLF